MADDDDQEPLAPMQITKEELEFTLALKQQVEEDPEFQGCHSDFDYAQVTLFCVEALDEAEERLRSLRSFREEYKIHDNLLEGVELILGFIRQQPWFLLDVHVDEDHSVLAKDFSALQPSQVNTPEEWRVFMGGFYYLFQILQPDFTRIRGGILAMAELDGVGWNNFDINFMQRHHDHLLEWYPIYIKESRLVHSSVIGNLLHAMLKRLRAEHEDSPIEVGCQFDELQGRLETLFKIPNPQVAEARLLQKCTQYLTAHYRNRLSFQLPMGGTH